MAVTDISAAQRPNPVAAHPAAIGGHDDGLTAEAASAPGSRIVTARRATALLSVLAVMAVAAFGYEQAQDWSWAASAMKNAPRRILAGTIDPCWGNPGDFSMKTHESIGTRTICQGLCDMNKPECSAHIYMEGTKTCFLKLRCAKQVDSYIMTWMEDEDEDGVDTASDGSEADVNNKDDGDDD